MSFIPGLFKRRRYSVRLQGERIELTCEDRGPTPAGFCATRVLDAESRDEAERLALALVQHELDARGARPPIGATLIIEVKSVTEVHWWFRRARPLRGFTFYAEDKTLNGEMD